MAQTLDLTNFSSNNILARTKLTSDVASALSSLPVQNTQGFTSGPLLVGNPGLQTSEIATLTSPSSATSLPLSSPTKLAHNFNDDVLLLFGDSLKVYRANDIYGTGQQPPDTDFTLVGTVSIDPSNDSTSYTDAGGSVGMWYKFTYYNTSTTSETPLSDSVAAQAGQVHYVSLDAIRSAAGFNDSPNVTNSIIAAKRDAAEKEIIGSLLPVYQFPLPMPTNPIVVEIAKQLAAGMLIQEMYTPISVSMAKMGETKSDNARNGGGSFTSLRELVEKEVVLSDAKFTDLSEPEINSFGGYPDNTYVDAETGLNESYFSEDKVY